MNKRGFLEQASPPPLPNPPPLFPFLPIPYPLPLSTPATQATVLLACAAGAIVYCVIKVLAVSQRFGHPRVLGIPMIASTLPKLFQTGEKLGLSITNLQLNSVDAC